MLPLVAFAGAGAALSALGIMDGNKKLVNQANASMQATLESYKTQTAQLIDNMQQQVSGVRLSMTDVELKGDSYAASVANKLASTNMAGNLTNRLLNSVEMSNKLTMDNMKAQLDDLVYSSGRELENLRFNAKDTMMQTAYGAKYGTTTGWQAAGGIMSGAASGAMLGSSMGAK